MTGGTELLDGLDRLADRAESLAGAWAGRARASTTIGRERAQLRLLGVRGLDAAGKPLAWSALDRYLGTRSTRLGGGISLPFAMALVEYDLAPQRLAMDVASGAVDLAMEAELLREADRRALAEEEARRLGLAAVERIDANRTARHELLAVLGDPPRPWIGATIPDSEIEQAIRTAHEAIDAGADLVEVEVPIGRELADRLRDAGLEAPVWRPRDSDLHSEDATRAPTGSQRALAALRSELDEIAAERRNYVRVAATPPPLGAPESAVVAAFERIDVAVADPLAEIVDGHVAPERALADHAFAHALLARAGVIVSLTAGPLVVAPDLARGIPSDPATRTGRALALLALSVAIARGNGVPDEQLLIGALPAWLIGESQATPRAAAEVAIRRQLFPNVALSFVEPMLQARGSSIELWPGIVGAVVPPRPHGALILRRAGPDAAAAIKASRLSAAISSELGESFEGQRLAGRAQEHAEATVAAALATIERLADEGWRSILGDQPGRAEQLRLGAESVAERTETFDPLAEALAAVG
jgi:hypothetical protein